MGKNPDIKSEEIIFISWLESFKITLQKDMHIWKVKIFHHFLYSAL